MQSLHDPALIESKESKLAPHQAETKRLFDAAVVMLHARQYEHAATALHRVLTYAPKMPEAHANMGFALMGLAANFIARILENHRWIAYVGLAIILYVALDMIYRGGMEVWPHLNI